MKLRKIFYKIYLYVEIKDTYNFRQFHTKRFFCKKNYNMKIDLEEANDDKADLLI